MSIFYVSDDGELMALRFDNWKINLRTDPYERADTTSNTYYDWLIDRAYLMVPAQAFVMQMVSILQEFPPRQESASFTVGAMLEKLKAGIPSS